jgi:ATP-dependent helicase HrpB
LAARVHPDWLLDLFPERIREHNAITWNRTAERAEAVSALLYDELVIEESRSSTPEPNEASRLLAERALEAGLHRFMDPDELDAFLSRVAFAAQHGPIAALAEADVHEAVAGLATGVRSFAELKTAASDGGLERALRSRLGPTERLLDEIAPDRIRLGKRQVKVHYPPGQQPWIESRLQDFFGTRETPRVALGAVPVVVHLLAPNQRPVQQTSDLHGFWERLYPQVRRELMRRYPKHAWPENPMNPASTASR